MSDGTPMLDLALSITTTDQAPSCHDLSPPQWCSLSCRVRYQHLGCNDKLKRSTSSSLSPNLSKFALSAGMLHATSVACSLRASPCFHSADYTRYELTSFRHHALGSQHGYEHHGFQYGSLQQLRLHKQFPSSYLTPSTRCAGC